MHNNSEQWITNAVIATQDSSRRVVSGHLRIIDGRIAAISSTKPRISAGAKVTDAKGLLILPGFVQAHVHLCQTLFRNQADDLELLDWLSKRIWRFEAAHTASTLQASAWLGIHELLSSGTTCILDMGTVRHTESILHAVRESGIRASVGKCLMDHPKNTPPYLREPTDDALAEARKLFEKWNGVDEDRIRISYAPRFVISCTERLLKGVALLANAHDALVHTHASENRSEIALVHKMTKANNVEYLHQIGLTTTDLVLAHCIWLKPKEIALLKKTGTAVTHCPSSNMKLASGFAKVPQLRKKGITVALGADGAPCNNNLNMFQEMRLAALIHKPANGPLAMRAQEVLDMATREGAKALRWFDDIGSIEVGKKADLVAIDVQSPENCVDASSWKKLDRDAIASSVVYSTQPQHVRWTMVDGRMVYRNGNLEAMPAEKLMKKVLAAQAEIRKRVK